MTQPTTGPINPQQFFTSSTLPTNPPPPPQSGGLLSGIRSAVLSPFRYSTEEAVQGATNRFSELFRDNQPEITNRARAIFTDALIRRMPETYHQLLQHIQAFLRTPSSQDLNQIKALLNQLNATEIQRLAPSINTAGLNSLTTLSALLDSDIAEQPSIGSAPPTLTVGPTADGRLREAEVILLSLLENHEGALIQALAVLAQDMTRPDGVLSVFRGQLNDPQQGILTEGLDLLRRNLTSRADPTLRETKAALDAYRSGLERSVNTTELTPLLQNLHTKLSLLLSRRDSVPQIVPDQWGQVELFTTAIRSLIEAPDNRPPRDQLSSQTNIPLQILTQGFNAQRGIVEEATDILVEGVGRGITTHLATLTRQMIQSIFSPLPQTPSPASAPSIPHPAGLPEQSFLDLNALAEQGRQFLNSILASAGDAASQSAARNLSALIHLAFVKIQDHIQRNNENPHLLSTIVPMINRLQSAREQSSWTELTTALQEAFHFLQGQQVYLQGLRLPLNPVRTHFSPLPDFLQTIAAHQNALQPPEQRVPQTVSSKMIEQQEQLLKSRLASYGPIKLVAEKICGFNGNEAFYAEIFKALDPQADPMSVFRERLFNTIDHSDLNFIWRWTAKRSYDFLMLFSGYYVSSFVDEFLALQHQWIQNTPSSQQSREEWLIRLTRNWLAVTSGAYNSVANTPASQTKDFALMLEEAMKIPERNGGLTQQELFAAVGKTALDVFGPQIKWDETIDRYFKAEIPTTSPIHFLNPIVKALNGFCSFCLKAVVFVPQWIGNRILQGGMKIALNHTPFLKDYADQTMESLRRNTPTSFAMQRLIYRQMQKVLALLQRSLNEDPDSANALLNRDTNIKKVEITGLVEYALEILNKSYYRTQDRLHNSLQGNAPIRDRLGREIEDAALPEIMESAVMTISIAMKTLTNSEEMKQLFYDGLRAANDSFDVKQAIPDEEFAAVEKGIRELSDQILETTLFHTIGEKFDFTNEKQKRGIANFTRLFKEQTSSFTRQLEQKTGEILRGASLSPTALVDKISSMIELSTQYHHGRVEALGKVDGSRIFHTETKSHLNALCRDLLTHCTPIAEHLNIIKNLADTMVWHEKILHMLLMCQTIILSIDQRIQMGQLSPADLTFCKTQASLLQSHYAYLRSNQCPVPLANAIEHTCQEFSALNTLEDLQKAEEILHSSLLLFERLKQEKQTRLGTSPSSLLRQLERQLLQLTDSLPFSDQKEQLNQKILNLMLARNREDVESAAAAFSAQCTQINARNDSIRAQKKEQLRRAKEVLQPNLLQSTQEFSHLLVQNKTTIDNHMRAIATKTTELEQWSQAQNELPIWNLFVFDMQWVSEAAKNLAFDLARPKVRELFNVLYQRHSYVGFVNQVVLLPFLEEFGKHHLKNQSRE